MNLEAEAKIRTATHKAARALGPGVLPEIPQVPRDIRDHVERRIRTEVQEDVIADVITIMAALITELSRDLESEALERAKQRAQGG